MTRKDILLSLDEEVIEKLEQLAKAEHRSRQGQITYLIEKGLQEEIADKDQEDVYSKLQAARDYAASECRDREMIRESNGGSG